MTLAHDFQDLMNAAPAAAGRSGDVIERIGVRMTFAKDEEIYGQDEEAELIYKVLSGVVRTSSVTSDGRRQIGDFYYAGDLFGLEAGDEHRFSAEAITDCAVLVLKSSALNAAGLKAEFSRDLWRATAHELDRSQAHILLLGRKTAYERVASFLMGLARRHPGDTVEVPMSRQDMADYLGLTIETVSRMLTQLQASAVVEFPSCRQFQVRNQGALARLAA